MPGGIGIACLPWQWQVTRRSMGWHALSLDSAGIDCSIRLIHPLISGCAPAQEIETSTARSSRLANEEPQETQSRRAVLGCQCSHPIGQNQQVNPHQRCGCSDSPFARRDSFLYCRVWKWVGGGGTGVSGDTKKQLTLSKACFLLYIKC